MMHRIFSVRRSVTEWSVRGVLAVAMAVVGYFSVTYGLAEATKRRDPALAHNLMYGNGRITARLAEQRFEKNPEGNARGETARLARLALRQDPTAVSAVSTLGIQAQLRGDTQEARRLFDYAQKLSRRNLQAQLWALEDAVQREDIPGALRHYDTALRTSRVAPDLLFPILASAITDSTIRSNLVVTLAKRPKWEPQFIAYALANGADPASIASLFVAMRQAGVPVAPEASSSVVNRLVLGGALEDAWHYYVSVRPGADRRRSRDPQFTADQTAPSPFDWTTINDESVTTSIQRGDKGGIFDFSVRPSTGGPLLRQLLMLPPGSYQIEGRSSGIEQPEQSLPYWVLTCRDGRELGRVIVSNSTRDSGVFSGRFNVSKNCPAQSLALVARPSDEVYGVTGQIDRVQLAPVE